MTCINFIFNNIVYCVKWLKDLSDEKPKINHFFLQLSPIKAYNNFSANELEFYKTKEAE